MGYDGGSGSGAPPSSPTLQNMQSNLIDVNSASSVASGLFGGGYFGYYWSSTEISARVWNQYFASSGGNSLQEDDRKNDLLGVRCVRSFK